MSNDLLVYVIDDDAAARESLSFLVECAGYAVEAFESAIAFLEILNREGPLRSGCIVTDVRMPEMTGVELVKKLKELGVQDPILVITGHADVPMAIEAMKTGVDDFIEKPFDDEIILTAIKAALAKRRATAELGEEQREIEGRLASLSPRESEVMEGLVEGKANKVIAFDLGISARTVEVYRANVMTKMQAGSLSELVRLALRTRKP